MTRSDREESGRGPGHADTHWSVQAEGWAEHWARLADPAREAVAATVGIEPGTRLLDVGCGSGEFCILAAERGAVVSGIDAGEGMIEIARRRLPRADLRVGGAERLPWEAESFDVVTAFNSLQFADDFVAALGEMRRVAQPGGRIAICNWGHSEDCDLKPVFDALDDGQPPAIQDPPPLGEPGQLERLARESGLEPVASADVDVPYETPDRDTLYRALLVDAGLHGIEERRRRGRASGGRACSLVPATRRVLPVREPLQVPRRRGRELRQARGDLADAWLAHIAEQSHAWDPTHSRGRRLGVQGGGKGP